jgi:hypothetical protein
MFEGSVPRGKLFDSETEADYFTKMSARFGNKDQQVGKAKTGLGPDFRVFRL